MFVCSDVSDPEIENLKTKVNPQDGRSKSHGIVIEDIRVERERQRTSDQRLVFDPWLCAS